MSAQNDLAVGIDPTPLESISAAILLQMVQEAKPEANIGWVYVGAVAPDVVNNPRFERYIWIDTSGATPKLRLYVSGSWDELSLSSDAVVTSSIADGSVTLAKLNASGAARDLLRINAAGTMLDFEAPINCFNDNELPVAKLVKGASAGTEYLLRTSTAGTIEWFQLTGANILTRISAAEFLAKIASNSLLLEKLSATGGTSQQQIRVKNDLSGFEFFTPSTIAHIPEEFTFPNDSTYDIEPLAPAAVAWGCTFTHNQNAYPKYFDVWAENLASGLRIPAYSLICGTAPYSLGTTGAADSDPHPVQIRLTANTIVVYAEYPDLGYVNAYGAWTRIDTSPAQWRWRASAAF